MKKRKIKKIILSFTGIIILFILVVIINLIIFEKNALVISEGEPITNNNQNRALLVIDIQEATTGENSSNLYYKEKSADLISGINLLSNYFSNENSLVIYIRSEVTNPLINLINNSLAKGGAGAKFDKRLILNSEIEIVKSRNDAFINTELDNILTKNKISELYIVGLDAAYCINITSAAALNRNYKVHLVKEAILSESETLKDSMITVLEKRGITILDLKDIVRY